ncbi:MAG: metal-dependent phosphohydrolase [Pseudomonadota bacterium]
MFWPKAALASCFVQELHTSFTARFPSCKGPHGDLIAEVASDSIARLQGSSALYHDAEHTMLVVLAGQQILIGRHEAEPLEPDDWMHAVLSFLLHDIGFTAGACQGDHGRLRVIDGGGASIELPRGASDAFVQPHHVARGQLHVRERFAACAHIDAERLARNIGRTLFPVPTGEPAAESATEAGLVRAADLIGQLADPSYLSKTMALYCELRECGMASAAGYDTPADIRERYPEFFRCSVEPYLGPALEHLRRTEEGQHWIALLYRHLDAS